MLVAYSVKQIWSSNGTGTRSSFQRLRQTSYHNKRYRGMFFRWTARSEPSIENTYRDIYYCDNEHKETDMDKPNDELSRRTIMAASLSLAAAAVPALAGSAQAAKAQPSSQSSTG